MKNQSLAEKLFENHNLLPKTKKRQIKELLFVSEIFDNSLGDTQVYYQNKPLCWIAGNTIDEFAQEFYRVIEKFKI